MQSLAYVIFVNFPIAWFIIARGALFGMFVLTACPFFNGVGGLRDSLVPGYWRVSVEFLCFIFASVRSGFKLMFLYIIKIG